MKQILVAILCLCIQGTSGQSLQTLSITDGDLMYISAGTGEVIVFIHGAQEDYRVFMPQLELLSEEFKVVAYSRRYNYPNNNEINRAYSVSSEAEDLKLLISELNKPVHLVGHSYGGLIAMEFAINNPESVKSLTLSEPALVNWLRGIPKCASWYETVQEKLIEETKKAFITRDTTLVMKELFEFFAGADIQDQLPAEVLGLLKANLREIEALVNSPVGFDCPSPEAVMALDVPLMILTSGNTMPMLNCTNSKLVEIKPEATHHHMLDAGHEMWMTHPKKLADHLLNFIRQL